MIILNNSNILELAVETTCAVLNTSNNSLTLTEETAEKVSKFVQVLHSKFIELSFIVGWLPCGAKWV